MTRTVARRLERLETRAKEVAAACPPPHRICFVDTNMRVVSTYEMSTGKWTNFDELDEQSRDASDLI